MTEFETQNTVDVVIDDRSLTEARADLEEGLSSVPVDVQASVSSSGSDTGGGSSSEWREQHSLSRERNRLLEEIAEGIDEGNFDRAARSGGGLIGGGAAILGGGALLGVGALSGVLSNFSWPSLPEFGWPDLPDLPPPPKPGWTPIEVVEPEPMPVGDPREQPIEDPKEQPVEDPKTQPVEEPEPMQVAEPGWTPIEIGMPELSTSGATEGLGSSVGIGRLIAGGVGTALGIEILRGVGSNSATAASSSAGVAFPTPATVGATDQEQFNQHRRRFNKQTPDWLQLPEITGENKYPGSVFSAEGRQAQGEGIRNLVSAFNDLREDIRNTQEETSSTRSTEVNVESNVSVEGMTRREVEQAAEEAKQEALREFNRQISGRVR